MAHPLSKSPRLSIVIPTLADTAALEETLVSVLENRPDDCEIIVALACEYADPWNICEEVRFVQAPAGSSLVGCINLGVSSSRGEVISVLAAGWRATEGWTDRPLDHFDSDHVGAVIPLGVAADDRERVVSAGVRCGRGGRRITVAVGQAARTGDFSNCTVSGVTGPELQAGFWRARLLELAGPGFSPACGDSCADADMAVAVSHSGYSVVLEPESRVVTGAGERPRKAAFEAGLHAERLFWRSLAGRALLWSLVMHGVEIVRHAFARAPLGTLPGDHGAVGSRGRRGGGRCQGPHAPLRAGALGGGPCAAAGSGSAAAFGLTNGAGKPGQSECGPWRGGCAAAWSACGTAVLLCGRGGW